MYPNELFFGVTLYEVMIVVGLLSAMLLYRRYSAWAGLSPRLHNLVIVSVTSAVVVGYLLGCLAQAFYNWMDGEPFSLTSSNTGSTFLGGMTGGLLLLLAVYFVGGRLFFPDREHIKKFPEMMDGLAVCVPVAHGFGRIGCLMAGCCYGKPSVHGFYFPALGGRYLPTQLYEALFLFALAAVIWLVVRRKRGFGPPMYFIGYGVWRFFLEYLRGDARGKTVVPFLTPSQLVSVVLVAVGVAILVIRAVRKRRKDGT